MSIRIILEETESSEIRVIEVGEPGPQGPPGQEGIEDAIQAHEEKSDGTAHEIEGVNNLRDELDNKVETTDPRLSNSRPPTGGAGGVLSGTYPNPGFAVNMATQDELDAHTSATQTALDNKADLVAGKIPSSQLPSFVDDVLEYTNFASLPVTGETGKIYTTTNNGLTFRWSGTAYVEISASLALGETSATAYRGDRGKAAYDHSQLTNANPHGVTKAHLGLENVDDTSDADKPISNLTQEALNAKTGFSIVANESERLSLSGVLAFHYVFQTEDSRSFILLNPDYVSRVDGWLDITRLIGWTEVADEAERVGLSNYTPFVHVIQNDNGHHFILIGSTAHDSANWLDLTLAKTIVDYSPITLFALNVDANSVGEVEIPLPFTGWYIIRRISFFGGTISTAEFGLGFSPGTANGGLSPTLLNHQRYHDFEYTGTGNKFYTSTSLFLATITPEGSPGTVNFLVEIQRVPGDYS